MNSTGNPVVTNTIISSTWANALTADLATGLSTTICKDGQSTPTANIPMGSNKIISLANGTLATDAATYGQVAGFGVPGYTTTATAVATTTLTVASTQLQYFTGSTTQTVLLPVTSTLVLGFGFTIVNNSTGIVTVQSSGANAILALGPLSQATFTCILASGTTAASWSAKYSAFSPGQLAGVTSNTAASAGNIGELITASVVQGSAVSLVNNTDKTVTSVSLTAGEWDVGGLLGWVAASSTTITILYGSISSNNNATDTTIGSLAQFPTYGAAAPIIFADNAPIYPIPTVRKSLSTTTTIYLVGGGIFGISTLAAFGFIRATRVH